MVLRVDQPLTFSIRGGIIDVYSINHDHPIRIEFFDTEIESIRYFDISTQRTINQINQAIIVPATDLLFSQSYNQEEKIKVAARIKNIQNQANSEAIE
jgi:transcription-repair coupling factor (superfamily II helicase)